jgi:hypothetical protein
MPEEDRRKKRENDAQTALGKSEARIIRCARSLWAIREAFGHEYLLDRLWHYSKDRVTDEDRAFAEELRKWQYCGLAGLPGESPDDAVPF